jgi:4'-phosphopantetheinyl transferase
LAADAIDVWCVDLDLVGERLGELLDEQERERAAQIGDQRRRRRWCSSRGVLRELVGRYLECDPREPAFDPGAHSKPALCRDAGVDTTPALHFNLSHSGRLGLYAFAHDEVGIDVQLQRAGRTREQIVRLAISRRSFGGAAARRLGELPPPAREREFLRLWTRYEATLKLRGEGIGRATASFHDYSPPWIAHLDLGPTVAGSSALAYAHTPTELRLYRFS